MNVLVLALWLASLPVLAACAYLCALAIASRGAAPSSSPVRRSWVKRVRFDVLIPAHNDAERIAATVRRALALDYPGQARRVIVVASHCRDETAPRAVEAGALVWAWNDDERRGKSFALAYAFSRSLKERMADAVVVLEPGDEPNADLLNAFAERLYQGAHAVQARCAIREPQRSWTARGHALAIALVHILRARAREKWGLSCTLRGHAMCLSHDVLRAHASRAAGLDDREYALELSLAGVRVQYAPEAEVRCDGAPTAGIADLHRYVPRLLRRAVSRRDPLFLELAAELCVPSWPALAACVLGGTATSIALGAAVGEWPLVAIPYIAAGVCLGIYVSRGWQLSAPVPETVLPSTAASSQ